MTGVISQFSTSTGRGCWWAVDVLNHRKRWCDLKKKTKKKHFHLFIFHWFCSWKGEIWMCNWDGVWCIQAHTRTHTHIPCCYRRWTLGEVSIENGKLSPASVIDLLLSTLRHSLRVLVRLPTLQNPYQASRPPKTIICQQSPPIWCLLKRTVNSSLPSGELCKKKRISHLTACLSPPLQTAAGHVISRPWPVQSWFGDRLIAGS